MQQLTQIDDRFVIGIRTRLTASFSQNLRIIKEFWIAFHRLLLLNHLKQGSGYIKYGITFREHGILYYACAIPAKDHYPDDFEIFLLPRSTYLISMHIGPMDHLPATIHDLMKNYLPQHHFTKKEIDLVYYECYRHGFQFNEQNSKIELGIPIQQQESLEMKALPTKSILQGNGICPQGWSWFGMEYNMNLYKGCPHGCIYCDSRSDCYHVENFDIVRRKENELAILEMELKRKKRKGTIGIGSMSDTYHPLEKKYRITREALKLIHRYGYGVGIDTKSDGILEDLDLIQAISKQHSSIVKITITTADDQLCKIIEPHVVPSSRRFEVLEKLHEAGIFAGILLMPILPFINDTQENIKEIVYQAHLHHAKFIYPGMGVTLRMNQRSYFYYQLDQYFPGKRQLYEKHFHNTYSCDSPQSKLLYEVLKTECQRYGILYRMKDIVNAYQKEPAIQQLSFL